MCSLREARTILLFFSLSSWRVTLVPDAFFYSLLANFVTQTAFFDFFLGTSLSCHQLLTVVSDWRIFLIALRVI